MTIRTCSSCGNKYELKTGIQNWKNLFRKPTLYEVVILVILTLSILSFFQYDSSLNNTAIFVANTCKESCICPSNLFNIQNNSLIINYSIP